MPKVKKQWKTTHTNHDQLGNCMLIQQEPVHGNIRILLELIGENKRQRNLGEVNTSTKTLYVRRDRDKHYMLNVGGYGFNYTVINDLRGFLFDRVLLHEIVGDRNRYFMVPVDIVKSCGKVLNFKTQGFEVQLFLKHEYYEQFPVTIQEVNELIVA